MLQYLTLAQYHKNSIPPIRTEIRKRAAVELLTKVKINYCIPENLPGDWSGYTSSHFAAISTNLDLTVKLIKLGSDLIQQGTKDGCTPLLAAAGLADSNEFATIYQKFDHLQKYRLINTLLSMQVQSSNAFNPKSKNGVSHLHIACMVNHAEAVEFFIKSKVPLDESTTCEIHGVAGYTPLHFAIKYSSVEAADILLQHGADIHAKNGNGMSCVHLLIDRITAMTDFMKMGNRAHCKSYIEEIEKIESMIKLVLRTKARAEIFIDDTGLSALHLACTLSDKSVVEDLLKQDVDINMPVKSESRFWSGWTPLHFAACCNIEVMMLLMQNGADILMKNSKGETPLDLCAKRFTPADIQLMLSKRDEYKDIMLSDNSTNLSDLLLAMNDYTTFSKFLKNLKDINLTLKLDSPIWPGYNLLHLCVSLNEKTKRWREFREKFDSSEEFEETSEVFESTKEPALERYNCAEEEEALYWKRIQLCLKYGVSVNTKNAKGQSSIHLAFGMMKKSTVMELLSCSEKNVVDQDGLSHLHIACAVGNLDAVENYLSKGADVNCRVRIGFSWYKESSADKTINVRENSTPLHVAMLFGSKNLIKYLLKCKADVYAKDSLDLTPIHLLPISAYAQLHEAKLMPKAIPDLRDSVSKIGFSHLHVAAYVNDRDAVKQLLSRGAKVNRAVDANVGQPPFVARFAGKTPLHVALDENSHAAVEALLKGGANVHAKDLNDMSPLQYAMQRMDDTATKHFIPLLKSGKCEAESTGATLLHAACRSYDIEWAKKLLKQGTKVNARIHSEGDFQGATPLYLLVDNANSSDVDPLNFINFVKLLISNGADVNIDCRGRTPLHRIYEYVYPDFAIDDETDEDESICEIHAVMLDAAVLLLKSQTSYVNPTDSQGFSHFHLACVINDVGTIREFLDHGVHVNLWTDPFAAYSDGLTPLHVALAHRSREAAYLLLERGAEVNAKDANGNTPLHAAIKRGFVDLPLIETMIRHGADIHAENLAAETLLDCLLGSRSLTFKGLEFLLKYDCPLNIFKTAPIIHKHIVGSVMYNSAPDELLPILNRFMQVSEVKKAIQNGFNVIGSIVSIDGNDELNVQDYLNAIEFLIGLGYGIDQQDTEGKTALHSAVSSENVEAIDALLQLGADMNVVDNKNKSPLSYALGSQRRDSFDEYVVEPLTCHLWKMRFCRLDINDSNLRCLAKAETMVSLASLEQSCQGEWAKAKETEICRGLTVSDFLSELGAIAEYPRMLQEHRDIVDQYFTNSDDIRAEFPQFCGLLAYQYRKALVRMEKLHEPAK